MNEIGIVESTMGKYAQVKIDKKDECDKCGMCMFPKGASQVLITAVNDFGAEVGDTVKIEVKPRAKTLGILLVFVVPLILIILSATIGYFVIKSEFLVVLTCITTLIFWYGILSLIDKKLSERIGFCSVISEIIKRKEEK